MRTAVATGSVKLVLPQALTAKNVPVVGSKTKSRSPKYVNPTSGNLLDIYVDSTLIQNVDGQVGSAHSMYVPTGGDGTASLGVPLYSAGQNLIVAIEWDPTGNYVLAIGETNPTNIVAGSANAISLTLLMNARSIAIVSYPALGDVEVMNGQIYYGDGNYQCPGSPSANGFRLFPADYEGVLVPVAGYGGTLPVVLGNVFSDNGGTTHLAQSPTGTDFASFDANCDGLSVNASASNPAAVLWNDFINNNYWYYAAFPNGVATQGVAQGLYNLLTGYAVSSVQRALLFQQQIAASTVTGAIDIQGLPPSTPTPSPQPSGPSPLQVSTTDVEIIGQGAPYAVTLGVTETGYAGLLTEDDGGSCTGIASFSSSNFSGQPWNLVITGSSAGTCTVTIADQNNQTANVSITVTISGLGFQSVRRKGH